ncbi:MAG TPA: hypothetical protein VGX51_04015 [Solirubrobacteraceae bacterium]|jgi:hypothetical protein|nr:hypothetical protein [Solirubrobacteraceae bacterium]
MADPDASDGAAQNSSNDHGVLANLPRTRPQRSTPRRAAARGGGSSRTGGPARTTSNGSPRKRARADKAPTRERARTAARPKPAAASSKRAPVQGYDSDSETASGSVQPPGAIELLGSAAELVGELAKSGLSRSERLIKDIASRLPLS